MNRVKKLLIVTPLLAPSLVGLQTAVSAEGDVPDQCPTVDGYQPVDICVPPSKPRAWITTICVKSGEGTARIRLKNNGDFATEQFWVHGAGADRLVNVKPGAAKTIRAKRLKLGKPLTVIAHGLIYDYAVVGERNCP